MQPEEAPGGSTAGEPIEAVAALVRGYGVQARVVRGVLAALTERSWTLAELVPALGVPRRTVEEVIRALGRDGDTADGDVRVAPARTAEYRARFGYDRLRATALADPLGPALARVPDLVETVRGWCAGAPAARRALDHVPATPETAVRRALWLDARFDLDGARLLCVGDHDLTALTACLLRPELAATVVDVDEDLLAYVDRIAAAHRLRVRCVAADLRFALPRSVAGTADLAFTDPPYTPQGVRLFVGRAVQGLRDGPAGRVLLAYGYSGRTPALGVEVQHALGDLHLAIEAIWPQFNRYTGAQAIGGASDLYTLAPTAKSVRTVASPRFWAGTAAIYTHGAQSVEGAPSGLDAAGAAALLAAAGGPDDLPVCLVGPGGIRTLGSLWTHGLPAPLRTGAVAVDATVGPPGWLPRILLAVDAARLAVALPSGTTSAVLVAAVLVAAKWRVTRTGGILVAEAVAPESLSVADRVWRHVLDRAHGGIGNVVPEALRVHAGLDHRPGALHAGVARLAGASLMELPLHQIVELRAQLVRAVARPGG